MLHSQYLAKNNAALCGRQIKTNSLNFGMPFSGNSIPAAFPTMEAIARHKKALPILRVLAVLPADSGNIHTASTCLLSLFQQCCMRLHWLSLH